MNFYSGKSALSPVKCTKQFYLLAVRAQIHASRISTSIRN